MDPKLVDRYIKVLNLELGSGSEGERSSARARREEMEKNYPGIQTHAAKKINEAKIKSQNFGQSFENGNEANPINVEAIRDFLSNPWIQLIGKAAVEKLKNSKNSTSSGINPEPISSGRLLAETVDIEIEAEESGSLFVITEISRGINKKLIKLNPKELQEFCKAVGESVSIQLYSDLVQD